MQKKLQSINHPYICAPIVGRTKNELLVEIERVKRQKPDLIEWRADFFEELHDVDEVIVLANKLKESLRDIPLLFTIRSEVEGGNPISLSENEINTLLVAICEKTSIDLIDYELRNPIEKISHIRKVSNKHGKLLILSYHNFNSTPSNEELLQILHKAASYHGDIGKIAVMPNCHADVIRLLQVTEEAKNNLPISIATMAMGDIGAISRMAGWIFGSDLVFSVGDKPSAPGQILIEDLRMLIQTMKKYQA
ncbi:type I 3-dehydroquinate dehydratase [Robertmurraya massiliosenegalensis]|uniref:type I 3-dehydroquinate dehydratase n=1 Tax=Robertmurraya massiliosenegalensis TaxID=1287657 RepID=UPI0002F47CEE|nr:type I 3-dehydroquinate dehydratase [Robertmurraya massiliosenegalensis]